MEKEKRPLQFPELEVGRYLIQMLFEVGPTSSVGMGEGPVTWLDLMAFNSLTGDITEAWEARVVIELSRSYLEGRKLGENIWEHPPWPPSENEDDEEEFED